MVVDIAVPAARLTPEQVMARLGPRLRKGDVLRAKRGLLYDFSIRRSAGVGVCVKVKAAPEGTVIRVFPFVPSLALRFVKSFVLAVFLSRKWKAMETEVAGLLRAPATPGPSPASPPGGPRAAATPGGPAAAPSRPRMPAPASQRPGTGTPRGPPFK